MFVKFQISYNMADLEEALRIAQQTAEYADVLQLGSLLLLSNGKQAIARFRELFPDKELWVDTRLTDNWMNSIDYFASCGVKQISVLAGISNKMIQQFTAEAHSRGLTVSLDLIASPSPEQAVYDAQALDVDSIIYRNPMLKEDAVCLSERWASVKGNTSLPIYISGNMALDALDAIKEMSPYGVIVGNLITNASNPIEVAQKIKKQLDE